MRGGCTIYCSVLPAVRRPPVEDLHLSQKSKQMGLSNSSREPFALDLVVGARPNLVKVAPLIRELQHEDRLMFLTSHSPMSANQWSPYSGSNDLFLEA